MCYWMRIFKPIRPSQNLSSLRTLVQKVLHYMTLGDQRSRCGTYTPKMTFTEPKEGLGAFSKPFFSMKPALGVKNV